MRKYKLKDLCFANDVLLSEIRGNIYKL